MLRFLLTVLFTLSLPAANLVQNPGFDDPVLGSTFVAFDAANFIPGWTWDGPGRGLLLRTDYSENSGTWLFPAFSGQNSLDITGPGWTGNNVIYQDIPTIIGQQYLLTFSLGNQEDSLAPYSEASAVEIQINGTTFATPSFGSLNFPTSVQWATFSFSPYTATQTTTRLAFRNTTPSNDNYAGLDDVIFEPYSDVPEPVTALPVIAAIMAAAATKKRSL